MKGALSRGILPERICLTAAACIMQRGGAGHAAPVMKKKNYDCFRRQSHAAAKYAEAIGLGRAGGRWSRPKKVIDSEYAARMMAETAPERDFGVLSPTFKGCEGGTALPKLSQNGCHFLPVNKWAKIMRMDIRSVLRTQ